LQNKFCKYTSQTHWSLAVTLADHRADTNRQTENLKLPTLRKIKRGVCQLTSRHKTPHLILPDCTQAHPPP
ncbi:MAG: hypothetical protein LC109_00015, partial [Bacteroidia bacterium]|nr:hypothetical protein [Bacteroidia bacterium]